MIRLPYCFILGTILSIMERNSDNLGETLPNKYTILSEENTANTHEKNIMTVIAVNPI